MTDNERDTKFAGVARLVIEEVYANGPQTIDVYERIIAQRAYDLVAYALYKARRGCSMEHIADLTSWPDLRDFE